MSKKVRDICETENKIVREIDFHPEKAVQRELKDLPEQKRDAFLLSLMMMSKGMEPTCEVGSLDSLGHGVYELKINGKPAWRCIYTTAVIPGTIVVLHATKKTTNGCDRQIANVVAERLKTLRDKLKADRKSSKATK
jgi:phage-related protein